MSPRSSGTDGTSGSARRVRNHLKKNGEMMRSNYFWRTGFIELGQKEIGISS
jgi:hypothetical protein